MNETNLEEGLKKIFNFNSYTCVSIENLSFRTMCIDYINKIMVVLITEYDEESGHEIDSCVYISDETYDEITGELVFRKIGGEWK